MSAASRPRPRAYEVAIGKVAMLFTDLTEAGVNLRMMNLGGGFPVRYATRCRRSTASATRSCAR
jgi:diaminopimelate decarboxylase